MSGAIIYDRVIEQPFSQQGIYLAIIFLIWGFCEGFSYIFICDKINVLYESKNTYLNIGAIAGGILCMLMHGGISLNPIIIADAITMFIFIYGTLLVKNITGNAWGCIFSFFFLWNAFPKL